MENAVNYKKISVFEALGARRQLKLSLESPQRSLRRRETLYLAGDEADYVCIVQSGRVKLARQSPGGKALIWEIVGPGEVFGLEPLFGQELRESRAVAMQEARILLVDRNRFRQLLFEHPDLSQSLLRLLHERLQSSRESLSRLAFQDVRSRLAGQLLDLARRQGVCQGDRAELEAPLTHQDLASLIGSTRETTTATLNQLRRARLIQFDRRRIVIPRISGLEALAAG